MEQLAINPDAFIRPSPSAGTLGGVGRKTRETMLICEAAGFDVTIIETVGVGQSETTVASMVDFFLVLMIAGAGDELQGIKKGVLEVADSIVINKADGDNIQRAQLAKHDYEAALHMLMPASPNWSPPVKTCSSITGDGIENIWQMICEHKEKLTRSGEIPYRRKQQALEWMGYLVDEGLAGWFFNRPEVQNLLPELKVKVENGVISPGVASDMLLEFLTGKQ